ncbi:hypothetical protein PIB30_086668 [Stylosanthes scabra]|uniref:Uncharacterized protein n=1 Tax=Stylosanthes scabra TaxID=79078 RepID=A0ABU6TTW8_9FABA|nr:hypothetical protein [Stylosanthes scabra]
MGEFVKCDLVECKEKYIKVVQYPPKDGSQEITVDIINTCVRVPVVDVRVDCGSFLRSGVPLPTERLKPVGGNECLLNNGDVLYFTRTYFQYSNPQILPLNVTSIKCLPYTFSYSSFYCTSLTWNYGGGKSSFAMMKKGTTMEEDCEKEVKAMLSKLLIGRPPSSFKWCH